MLKPPIPWYGGKQKLVDKLLTYIPEHECYVEPFGGAGALLFAKEPSKVEIYNDLHKDVVNLYIILRDHPEELATAIELTPFSRHEYNLCWTYLQDQSNLMTGFPHLLIERARCFFVIAKQSFGGHHASSPTWSCSKSKSKGLAWMNVVDKLPEVHARLRRVVFECRPAAEVIKKEDGSKTFQYLDPPYLAETRKETERYKYEMTDTEHFELLTQIKNLRSMFLVSGYHNQMYDDMLAGWHYYDFSAVIHGTDLSNPNLDKQRIETIWWNDALQKSRVGSQIYIDLEAHI